jgi:hypothetical protein
MPKIVQPAEMPVLTYSRLSTFLDCPMGEYYQYEAGGCGVQSTTPQMPFVEGEFGHYALAQFHTTGRMLRANLLNRVDRTRNELIKELGGLTPEFDDDLRVSLATLTGACLGYRQRYATDRDLYEVLYVEEPFSFEFDAGDIKVKIIGKMDRLSKVRKTGQVMLWENKFVGTISPGTYMALPLNLQGLIYLEGANALTGKYPDMRAWDYVLKSRLRRKKDGQGGMESFAAFEARVMNQYMDEGGDKFFRPPPFLTNEKVVASTRGELSKVINNWWRMKSTKTWCMSFGCLGMFGHPCPFINACKAKLDGKKDGWDAPECQGCYKPKTTQHPEVKKESFA